MGESADAAVTQLTEKYGPREAHDAKSISRQMFRAAEAAGILVPVSGGSNG